MCIPDTWCGRVFCHFRNSLLRLLSLISNSLRAASANSAKVAQSSLCACQPSLRTFRSSGSGCLRPDGFLTSSGIRSFCSSLLLPRLANRDKSGDGSLGALACQKFGASSVRSPIVEPLLLSSSSSSSRSACQLVIYLSCASGTSADPDFLSRPTRRRSSSPWSKPPGTLARRRYPLAVSRDLVPGARVA